MINHKEFEQLYNEFYSSLVKILFGITGRAETSEDLCQEAFIRLYNHLEIFSTPQDAKYWLIRVAKNLAFSNCKRQKTERKVVDYLQRQPIFTEATAEKHLIMQEEVARVQRALQKLPIKYRQVLVLKEYSALCYADIAKMEGISENNVKIRVYRARTMLEKILTEEDGYVFK